jgi:putative Mg2+ transporter-C (MgtC) family protein
VHPDFIEILLRLGSALLAGAAIGVNRDLHGKPAGVRLNALVTVGATVFVLCALGGVPHEVVPADAVSRVVQGIAGGIGFLGAGMILKSATGKYVQNLNTAATVWVAGGIGIACGIGAWPLVLGATAAVLFILIAGLAIDRALFNRAGPEILSDKPD